MNNVIQTVGAYAGLVALLGLVVLSLLCFAQARDIRRLREWAGGAPERDAEVRELSEIVAEERSQELQVLADREQRRLARSGYAEGSFWDRLGRPGRIMVIVATVLILGAAAAWAGTTLLGDDGDGTNQATRQGGQGKRQAQRQAALKPADIKVGVLNGTGGTESGLGAQYAAQLEDKGYDIGAIDDAPDVFDTSIVMYLKGRERAAKKVARAIDIDETGLMTSEVSALTPGAMVTAVIGTDHSGLPAGE